MNESLAGIYEILRYIGRFIVKAFVVEVFDLVRAEHVESDAVKTYLLLHLKASQYTKVKRGMNTVENWASW